MTKRFSPVPEGRVIETPTSKNWIDASGVVWNWGTAPHDTTLADAKEYVAAVRELAGGRPIPLLVILPREYGLTHEARAYFNSEEAQSPLSAFAFVAPSRVARMVGNLYLRLIRPRAPMRLFTDHEEALAWLRTFVK